MESMDAKKNITLTMDDIKEIDFHLQKAVKDLQQQIEDETVENISLIREKKAFIEEIIIKLSQ